MARDAFEKIKLDKKTAYEKKMGELGESGLIKDFLEVLFDELKDLFYKKD
jgi:hypothetical protein